MDVYVDLFFKLTLTPALVVLASLAGKKWGLKVSGMLAGLPVVAGPVLFFLALDQGPQFAARAAEKALLGPMAFSAFVLAYARVCGRSGILLSVLAGWAAFFLASVACFLIQPPLWLALALSLAVLGITSLAMPKLPNRKRKQRAREAALKLFSLNMLLRAASALALALGLITFGRALGPDLSGVLAPFPVVTTVLAGFSQKSRGPEGANRFLAGSLRGMLAFALFSLVLAAGLERFGIAASFWPRSWSSSRPRH